MQEELFVRVVQEGLVDEAEPVAQVESEEQGDGVEQEDKEQELVAPMAPRVNQEIEMLLYSEITLLERILSFRDHRLSQDWHREYPPNNAQFSQDQYVFLSNNANSNSLVVDKPECQHSEE